MSALPMTFCLFTLGFATSFIGTNTGGSSLITIPVMISMGIPASSAIAVARTTSIGTLFAGIRQYHQHGKIDYKTALPAAILSIMGASIGAMFMIHIPTVALNKMIGALTLLLLASAYLCKKYGQLDLPASQTKKIIGYGLFLGTSTLGGFYGGQGLITTYIFIFCFHKTMTESAGTRKIAALTTAFAAVFIYGFHGLINGGIVLALMGGTMLGASFGAAYALKQGDAWLTRIFNGIAILLALKLIIFDCF